MEVAKFQRKVNRDARRGASCRTWPRQGVTVTRDVDQESFKKAMAPVYSNSAAVQQG